jgi:mono/diheme cytochrome c family protein
MANGLFPVPMGRFLAAVVMGLSWVGLTGAGAAQEPANKPQEPPGQKEAPAAEKVDFVKQIKPILERSCLKCHGPDMVKGEFRLDTKEHFFRGGLAGAPVVPGDPEGSLLYELITLGPDEEGRMPAEGEPLPKAEVELIRKWIEQGAHWPDGVTLASGTPKPDDPIAQMLAGPGLEVTEAEKAAVKALQERGVLVLKLAQNTNWLRVDFSLQPRELSDKDLALLADIRNLVELDLGGAKFPESALEVLSRCKNLVRLHLEKSTVTDQSLQYLAELPYLRYLNLYGTAITDQGLTHLHRLKNLRRLYVWQTKVTPEGIRELKEAVPELEVVTGIEPEPQSAEAKESKPEEKPKEEQKANQGR